MLIAAAIFAFFFFFLIFFIYLMSLMPCLSADGQMIEAD